MTLHRSREYFLLLSKAARPVLGTTALAILLPALCSGAEEIPAVRANDFLGSIGVCSAVSRRGETLQHTIEAAQYLGLRWVRSGYESGVPIADLIELHKKTGVRFSYGLASGGTDLPKLLEGARQLAAVGALLAFEGNNEPNNWGVTYEGQRGGWAQTWVPVAKLQRDLYRAVKNDLVLKQYPVWNASEIGAESDNVGLQFLTIPAGAGTLMPDGTQYADYANCHNYMTHPNWSGLHDNQTWMAADPTAACRVDGLFGNHGLTWRRHFAGYPESALVTLPKVTTETGVTLGGPITEQVQASLYLVYSWTNSSVAGHTPPSICSGTALMKRAAKPSAFTNPITHRAWPEPGCIISPPSWPMVLPTACPANWLMTSRTGPQPFMICCFASAVGILRWWCGTNGLRAASTTLRLIWARLVLR
ncbi:MAG TPA: hypothetical protein VG167_13515 [Verrucomicrobiae bacterium]|nr:hypothetical protein [Verrucomicrobiae bacterium]